MGIMENLIRKYATEGYNICQRDVQQGVNGVFRKISQIVAIKHLTSDSTWQAHSPKRRLFDIPNSSPRRIVQQAGHAAGN